MTALRAAEPACGQQKTDSAAGPGDITAGDAADAPPQLRGLLGGTRFGENKRPRRD
jgi:hypothetical protein